ncbi:MAG: TlpA disulfide reductase family protein [Bryobacteraceae bacterium]|nr:TlpA disulfide reductase family protein [Bryobacteraceae bacterium]
MLGAACSMAMLMLFAPLTPVDQTGYRELVRGHRGNVVLVSFWATWCIPCRAELPALGALQKKVPGFRLVTVSADEPEQAAKAEKFLREARIEGKGYVRDAAESDDKFIPAVDPKWSGVLPASFLYGRDGKLIRAFVGEVKASELESAVRTALRD